MNKENWIELEIGRIYATEKSLKEKIFGSKNPKYVLILYNKNDRNEKISMVVGQNAGEMISTAIEKVIPEVPFIEVLFKNVIESFEIKLEYVLINGFNEEGYFKSIVKYNGKEKKLEFEARTVDLIALSLRHESPIYIEKNVFEKSLD
ncbi:MAG: DUF151 domain-containing protein [Flavobacterium sp.]|uniref:bifunctional nuclease family protein n=1 Tax=Flavobacterium sp. TaxID=239 RepID=UPI0022C753E1|nr:bifunctional nuclease domain-containing protein [Flavobacterium sp.]MCZ8198449.1 DUF151 domain-containing protein [Flavobacterium sp.]